MSHPYYIVVDSRDLPCTKDGESSESWVAQTSGCFPGAYAYDTETGACEAASKFTLATKESHAVMQIRHRVVYVAKTELKTFNG